MSHLSNLAPVPITDSRLAALCAEQTRLAFLDYQGRFHEITERARHRFWARDWPGSYADAAERLHIYTHELDELAAAIQDLMGARFQDRVVWMAIKAVYSSFIVQNSQWEIAESFFNSLTRRVFATEGVDQAIEFVDTDFDAPPTASSDELVRQHTGATLPELLTAALTDCAAGGFAQEAWENLGLQVQQASNQIVGAFPDPQTDDPTDFGLEMIATSFFRGRGAYLVGRVKRAGQSLPLALCLRHEKEQGIRLDAVLHGDLDLSILFSYTRAYFRVAVGCPYELVRQLRALMPHKRLVDLYNAIGYHRHGKTELYRDFMAHMRKSSDRFVEADGTRGMVMLVFTLPSYDVVFKLIKDSFDYPKHASRSEVKERYQMVFEHDRAGRMVEAHRFEHLRIARDRFDPALLEELCRYAAETVRLEGDNVVIAHAYVERRVRPLNLYLREVDDARSVAAVLDYGLAIKDLAASNIFAGDIFTKNFGVTRTGRVVFYDYDELCFLSDCNFRDLPQPTTYEQEMASEPWYSVRENDIFPEEFPRFLSIPEPARSALFAEHGDLFRPEFWRGVQARLRAGEILEISPYTSARRLPEI
ncbi:bifunctional isocitrate dehydrogenase kinase/phosphatase [bacterium]|nr:bifunctional isocitrate dehydrogenase kinase/phosphatase [bacterium]